MKTTWTLLLLLASGLALSHAPCNSPPPKPKPNPSLSEVDRAYLRAHNKRRRHFHTGAGKSFVRLKWSHSLKRDAKVWSDKLVNEVCENGKIYHDPNNKLQGENITLTKGTGSWAKKPTAEKVLTRFVERELPEGRQKGHLTQVLWRATKYVGCAESSKSFPGGKQCHVTVCRYIKPGNCNMGKYIDWQTPTFKDDSPCGPECPEEGCF